MDIGSVMTQDVEVVAPEASLQQAASKMKALDVGSLPVCNGRRLLGMITDRDIAIRAVAEGRHPVETAVRDVMTPEVVYATADQSVEEAADLMSAHQIRRLPIVNQDRDLVGIVSLGDLAVDTTDDQLASDTLEDISIPARPKRGT
jgi:CBS domain-containing protein